MLLDITMVKCVCDRHTSTIYDNFETLVLQFFVKEYVHRPPYAYFSPCFTWFGKIFLCPAAAFIHSPSTTAGFVFTLSLLSLRHLSLHVVLVPILPLQLVQLREVRREAGLLFSFSPSPYAVCRCSAAALHVVFVLSVLAVQLREVRQQAGCRDHDGACVPSPGAVAAAGSIRVRLKDHGQEEDQGGHLAPADTGHGPATRVSSCVLSQFDCLSYLLTIKPLVHSSVCLLTDCFTRVFPTRFVGHNSIFLHKRRSQLRHENL